jgi:tetratricopeptide (TPR) repeat protein
MICKNCGETVEDGLLLCPHCGQEVSVVPKKKASEPAPVVSEPAALANEPAPVAPARALAPARRVRPVGGHGLSGWVWLITLIVLISCVMVAFAAAGFGGLYQGLKERDRLNQVTSREHYNRGLEHLKAHETELAMAEFEESIKLDPRFLDAYERLKELRVKATIEPTPTSVLVAEVVTPTVSTLVTLSGAQADYDAGKWTDAIAKLLQLKAGDPTADAAQIGELLLGAYMKNGEQLLAQSSMEEALRSYDAALALKPDDSTAAEQKRLIDMYITASGLAGANWEEAIRQMTELYTLKPDFADVKTQLYEDNENYGDLLAQNANWCEAADHYSRALELDSSSAKLKAKQADVAQQCQTNPPTPTPVGQRTVTDTINSVLPTQPMSPTQPARPTKPAVAASQPVTGTPATAAAKGVTATVAAKPASAPAVAAPGAPVLSGVIAYSGRDPDQVFRIYQLKLDGKSSPEILVQEADQPAFSQDGTKLAYHSRRPDTNGLRVADLGGGNGLNVTKYLEDGYPSWGPDGTQLVLASTRESDRRWRIFTTWAGGIADGAQVTLGQAPAWSRQGAIAYHGCDPRGGSCGLWKVAPNGGGAAPLTTSESDTAPAWSPDGTRLAFMSARDGNWEIYMMNADGSQPTRLTSNGSNDGLPAWSPDGSTVAFVSDRGGAWGLYAVAASGGEAAKIWDTPNVGQNWMDQRLAWRK